MCIGWAKWSSRWLSYSSCFTALVTVTLTASRQRWKLEIRNWRRAIPAQAPAVACICCVTLNKSFYLADYHFSHLKSWDDSKNSIYYLAIFCVFILFLFKIRNQNQESSTEIKTAALHRPHTSKPHLASNSSLLLVSVHFFPSECSQACMFMDHHCCLCSSQTEQLKQESLAHLLSDPSQREFNRPPIWTKENQNQFRPLFWHFPAVVSSCPGPCFLTIWEGEEAGRGSSGFWASGFSLGRQSTWFEMEGPGCSSQAAGAAEPWPLGSLYWSLPLPGSHLQILAASAMIPEKNLTLTGRNCWLIFRLTLTVPWIYCLQTMFLKC